MSIESLVQGRILILKINSDLDESVSATLEGILNPLLSQHSGIGHIVLDLGANQISHASFRHLSPLALSLRKDKKQIYVLSSQRSVHRLIKSEGMDRSLKPINDVAEIHVEEVRTTKPEGPKLDVNFVNPLIEGTLHVLKVQAQMEVTPGKPKLKDLENPPPNIDIAGIIGVTSSGFNGGIALCFPEKVFLSIMSSMLGEDYKEISQDLEDGAGELLNMIFGHAKTILNEQGHSLQKALPTVVRAPNMRLNHAGAGPALLLPFTAKEGDFYMEIRMEKF